MRAVKRILRSMRFAIDRLRRGNRISSADVSPKSIKGRGISIRPWSRIDSASAVGSYTYIGSYTHIGHADVGRYVSIGDGVVVGPGGLDLGRFFNLVSVL